MKLGVIAGYNCSSFQYAKDRNIEELEFDVNVGSNIDEFVASIPDLKSTSEKTGVTVSAIGRWGADRISADGSINEQEQEIQKKLISAAADLECTVYITGCNFLKEYTFEQNCQFAILMLKELVAYGEEKGVKICTYNCDWNNFVYSNESWSIIHKELPTLGIKYDPSHCIYRKGDYLAEMRDWADRFYHVHIKGSLIIDGERFDDPPAGMDSTNWGAFMAILYAKGYNSCLSLEPHSSNWTGELGNKGLIFSVKFMKQFII